MSQYFGVIGNRDFIKIDGVRRPFWDFLDRQPDGWLTSLVYRLKKEQLFTNIYVPAVTIYIGKGKTLGDINLARSMWQKELPL